MLLLDHLFIIVSPSAPEADGLIEIGLIEGPSNEHPGQGTANRRFFLANTTIEFIFVHNIAEAMNGAGKDLKFVERAIDIDASPFGLVTRWSDAGSEPDFAHWKYQPDYFPEPMQFLVGKNSNNFAEPLCICMPPKLEKPSSMPEPTNRDWTLTQLDVSFPRSVASGALTSFAQCDMVNIRHNEDHHLKLVFNDGRLSKKHLFPDLHLTIEC